MSENKESTQAVNLPDQPEIGKTFGTVGYDGWKAEAEAFLGGAPFEKKLVAATPEGVFLRPLYTRSDAEGLTAAAGLPGQAPYLRGTRATGYKTRPWRFCQELTAGTPAAYNAALRQDLMRGQDAVYVLLDRTTSTGRDADAGSAGEVGACGVSLTDAADLEALFEGIALDAVPLHLPAGASPFGLGALFAAYCEGRGHDLAVIEGALTGDPVSELAMDGALPVGIEELLDGLAGWVKWAAVKAPGLRTAGVNAAIWHEAGGSATEELAFGLAVAAEYLRALLGRGMDIDTAAAKVQFRFALGPRFFTEVSKLRAARLLWARVVKAFGGGEEAQKIHLHARTGLRNKTVCDPYVNMLRTTTEAFSGVLGGADSMHVGPFDEVLRVPGEFSRRIARNTHTLLAEEFNCCETADPAGGSWYIEKLTDELARAAWALFQEVEGAGGMVAALEAGLPQERVEARAAESRQRVDGRRTVLLGTNLYPNPREKPLAGEMPDYEGLASGRAAAVRARRDEQAGEKLAAAVKACPAWSDRFQLARDAAAKGATLGQIFRAAHPESGAAPAVRALTFRRDAADFEALRRASADYAGQHGHPPRVFLARMGAVAQNKARADFTTGFFQAGGFECLDQDCFTDPDAAAAAFLSSGAPIAVLCSTDPTYPELVPGFAEAVKKSAPDRVLVLAGHPGDQEAAYREAGMDAFIHIRSNVRADLEGFLKAAGAL